LELSETVASVRSNINYSQASFP